MVSFLNTFVLLGLFAAIIPLLIHFFARKKRRRIVFSSLQFLKAIHTQQIRQFKFQQWLLLVLRMLAVCFIILTFARPTCKSPEQSLRTSNASIVIVMDRSVSMDRPGLLEKAKAKANMLLDMAAPEDEFALVRDDGRIVPETGFLNAASMKQWISNISVHYTFQSIYPALQQASDRLMTAQHPNREIYVISDMQRSGFNPAESQDSLALNSPVFFLPISGNPENSAMTGGGIQSRILQPGGLVLLHVEITGYGFDEKEVLVRIFLNNQPVAQKTAFLQGGATQQMSFQIRPEETGWFFGYIQIQDDVFTHDDQLYFSGYIPDGHKLILVGEASDRHRVRLLLNPDAFADAFFNLHEGSRLSEIDFSQSPDAIFFMGQPEISPDEIMQLKRYLKNGGGLAVIPGQHPMTPFNTNFLQPVLQCAFQSVRRSQSGYTTFGDVDWSHPVFEGLFEDGRTRKIAPEFSQYYTLRSSGTEIISLLDDSPFLIEQPFGQGKVMLLTSGIDEPWSDFRFQPFCAPLFFRMAAFLAQDADTPDNAMVVGQPLRIALATPSHQKKYTLEKPSGDIVFLQPERQNLRQFLNISSTSELGIYRFYEDARLLKLVNVQFDARESDFSVITRSELASVFSGRSFRVIDEAADLKKAITAVRYGRELWQWCAAIALFLLIAEMVVARLAIEKK